MHDLIAAFAQQLRDADAIGQAAQSQLPAASAPIQHVLVAGLGGSAFGGELSRNLMAQHGRVPVVICREYDVPHWVGPGTLAILGSYSGNTEETLSMNEQLGKAGAQRVAISSGGKLKDLAASEGFPCIELPTGYPPRAAAGYAFVQQLYILRHFDLLPNFSYNLEEAIGLIENFQDRPAAKALARALHARIPVLYSSDKIDSVAIRFRQQINENGKQLCWHHIIPEMNHNELVGWHHPEALMEKLSVVLLRSSFDHPRTQLRYGVNQHIIAQHTPHWHEITAKGTSLLAQMLYLLHFVDWVSVELAELNGVDPTPVKVIDFLKGELAKQ